MGIASAGHPFGVTSHYHGKFGALPRKVEFVGSSFPLHVEFPKNNLYKVSVSTPTCEANSPVNRAGHSTKGEHTEQAYAHRILTGRRDLIHTVRRNNGLSGSTFQPRSEYDPFGSGHGCSSVSAGLGMAIARDIKGKRERVITVINNGTTMAGQVFEAMSNAGYLDSNMVVILNDTRHSLHPKIEEGPKTAINHCLVP